MDYYDYNYDFNKFPKQVMADGIYKQILNGEISIKQIAQRNKTSLQEADCNGHHGDTPPNLISNENSKPNKEEMDQLSKEQIVEYKNNIR